MGGESSIVGMGTAALPAGYGCEPNAQIIASQKARPFGTLRSLRAGSVARLAQVHRRAKSALFRMTQLG